MKVKNIQIRFNPGKFMNPNCKWNNKIKQTNYEETYRFFYQINCIKKQPIQKSTLNITKSI